MPKIVKITEVISYHVELDSGDYTELMTNRDGDNWDVLMGQSWEGSVFHDSNVDDANVKAQFKTMIKNGQYERANLPE